MSRALWIPYLRFLLRSKGRHGLHAPFAYGFVEQVLQGRPPAGSCPADSPAHGDQLYKYRRPEPLSGEAAAAASTHSASAGLDAVSGSPAFSPRDFKQLIRIISYWMPEEIRLFPEVIAARPALAFLFPLIPIYNASPAVAPKPSSRLLWIGNLGRASHDWQPGFETFHVMHPNTKVQALVLFGTAQSRAHRKQAEVLLTESALPMGIDFWNGIFLASDPRFRARQRFRLKPYF